MSALKIRAVKALPEYLVDDATVVSDEWNGKIFVVHPNWPPMAFRASDLVWRKCRLVERRSDTAYG